MTTITRVMPLTPFLELLNRLVWNNSLLDWIISASLATTLFTLFQFLKYRGLKSLRAHTHNNTHPLRARLLVATLQSTRKIFVLTLALYAGGHLLERSSKVEHALDRIMLLGTFLQLGLWGSSAIRTWLMESMERRGKSSSQGSMLGVVGLLGHLALWAILILLTLDNLGVNITTLIAGLGVGGIAVALAVQNILGDLFSSLTIVLDKPFLVGDYVVVGDFKGTIEHIGLKTTRIRSLSGEQIVFSNSDLLQSRIRNFERMKERRMQFSFGVPLDSSLEKLQPLPAQLRSLVEKQHNVRFDRAHLARVTPTSFEFEVVYWILRSDHAFSMDVQQHINLDLVALLETAQIHFSHPTLTPRQRQESASSAS